MRASHRLERSRVCVDPYRLTASPQDADLILITHSHGDHYSPSDIARVRKAQTQFVAPPDVVKALGTGNSLAPGQSVEILGLTIDSVASYNVTKTNHPKANNWLGFVVNIGSNRIYCAGDTDLTPEMKALTDIDLPSSSAGGTNYTMDATEAAEATKFIQPTLAIHTTGAPQPVRSPTHSSSPRLAACNVKVLTAGQTIRSEDWSRDFTFVAHWTLDESSGLIASDSAGDYDATLIGGAMWRPMAGRLSGAIEFDGVDDCITTPFILNPSQDTFSVFAWVKEGAPGQTILSQIGGAHWLLVDSSTGGLATHSRCPAERGRSRLRPRLSPTVNGAASADLGRRIGVLYVDDVEWLATRRPLLPTAPTGLLSARPERGGRELLSGGSTISNLTRVIVP